MQSNWESVIKEVYKRYKLKESFESLGKHLSEEDMSCFIEAKLPKEEMLKAKEHLLSCLGCAEIFTLAVNSSSIAGIEVPQELIKRIENIVFQNDLYPVLEILLRGKEKIFELIFTNGDILLGQELLPASLLRSRDISDFKDEITILKYFNQLKVEVKVENKGKSQFSLSVVVTKKDALKPVKDLRIALLKDDLEVESYDAEKGKVTFEHILLGKYVIEISNPQDRLAAVLLDIKI